VSGQEERELFSGRYYGIWNVEGDGGPIALFCGQEDAERELARRRALPEDDDDHLTKYHHVFPADLVGVWWNSYDPDPRAESPLGSDEIIRCFRGDEIGACPISSAEPGKPRPDIERARDAIAALQLFDFEHDENCPHHECPIDPCGPCGAEWGDAGACVPCPNDIEPPCSPEVCFDACVAEVASALGQLLEAAGGKVR
jgi:hypothetical protein